METQPVKLIACSLGLGEIPYPLDFNYFHPVFHCEAEDGSRFVAAMRLHITESLDQLIFVDPRSSPDGGEVVNSTGSTILRRKCSYSDFVDPDDILINNGDPGKYEFYKLNKEQIITALLNGYDHQGEISNSLFSPGEERRVAFTSHDPSIIGGGNTILFRLINWLADLGIHVTVYSSNAGAYYPSWLRVIADFRGFTSYSDMCSAITEKIVFLFTMWHIEPMLKAHPHGKQIFHLRQTYEPINYGSSYSSMIAKKPAIEMIESLPIGVVTVSPHLHNWYKSKLGLDSYLVTNGIDLGVFGPETATQSAPSNQRKIISVGNPLHYLKAANVLGDAVYSLAQRRPDLSLLWEIAAGQTCDYNPFEGKPIPPNLTYRVHNGLSPIQMRDFYQSADVFVNPSLYEGFGLPTIEALACGTPVVQADNYGLDQILTDGVNCLQVPLNDAARVSTAVEKILDDPVLRDQLRENGIRISRKYSIFDQFMQFQAVFSEILGITFDHAIVDRISSTLRISQWLDSQPVKMPLVSVVIPSYNQADYLRQALDSLIAQTYLNWEAVVINDGSTDHTDAVLKEYAARDPRIKPYTKQNGGITAALNEGIRRASGEYFSWLSSDDQFYPNKLQALVNAFETLGDDYGLVYGGFDLLYEDTGELASLPLPTPLIRGSEFPEALRFDFIDGTAILVRMKIMRDIDGFNPPYKHTPDMELWMRIASKGYRFYLFNEKVSIRRMHSAQASATDMIYCRYDALWVTHYYLLHYHLLELYRYFDLSSDQGKNDFVRHWVSRVTHTDANVNHPLNQEFYWDWLEEGIKALPPQTQQRIFQDLLKELLNHRSDTYKIDYYIEKCMHAINQPMVYHPITIRFTTEMRDFRYFDRSQDPLIEDFFSYLIDLLIKGGTPLFAQEITHHNVNKAVDNPYKLAHSMVRYLSQFQNRYHDIAWEYRDKAWIPGNSREAIILACNLLFATGAKDFIESYLYDGSKLGKFELINQAETRISKVPPSQKAILRSIFTRRPTEPIFYYWTALILAGEGDYFTALDVVWLIHRLDQGKLDWRMINRMGLWLDSVGKYRPVTRELFIRVSRKLISLSSTDTDFRALLVNIMLCGLRISARGYRWIKDTVRKGVNRNKSFSQFVKASIRARKAPSLKVAITAILPKPVYPLAKNIWHWIKRKSPSSIATSTNQVQSRSQVTTRTFRLRFRRIIPKLRIIFRQHRLLSKMAAGEPLSAEDQNFVHNSISASREFIEELSIQNLNNGAVEQNLVQLIKRLGLNTEQTKKFLNILYDGDPHFDDPYVIDHLNRNPDLLEQIILEKSKDNPIQLRMTLLKNRKFMAFIATYIASTGEGSDECLEQGCLPVPIHFYYPIPDINDLDKRKIWERKNSLAGINFRQEDQLNLLGYLGKRFGKECLWPQTANGDPYHFFTHNGSFSYGCAAGLYCMVREKKPKHLIEVGSGNSSLIISSALQKNKEEMPDYSCEYTIIDPFPRDIIENGLPHLSKLVKERVELVDPALFSVLGENDILFIDSTHSVKAGSDVVFLILDVLPCLAPGTVIHIHDIPLPYEYAKVYFTNPSFRVMWTESYLLQAFLSLNIDYEILLGMGFLMEEHMDKFCQAFPYFDLKQNWANSGSFWIQRKK
jgi:glycosyltransferase involved in cell wall biosynthesis